MGSIGGFLPRSPLALPTRRRCVPRHRPLGDRLTEADVLLIGCVKSKQATAAEAKDLYTSALFARRRTYAEHSGKPGYIVSARLGLAEADEVIAPYDVYRPTMSARYRRAWGELVAAQLAERIHLRGAVVEIHAGDAYLHALPGPISALGAVVEDPVDAGSFGETLSWYDQQLTPRNPPSEAPDQAVKPSDRPPTYEFEDAVARLGNFAAARSVPELLAAEPAGLAMPGMYSWWVDEPGARQLSLGLGHLLNPRLIYVGQAGATRWPSGRRSTNTWWGRLVGTHLGAKAKFSTFRRSLASVLQSGAETDEPSLTDWMAAICGLLPTRGRR